MSRRKSRSRKFRSRGEQLSRGQTSLESLYGDPSDYIDPRDYLWNEYGPAAGSGWLGTINTFSDRAEGRDWPLFYTEQELAVTRGISRSLVEINPHANAALGAFTDFVIGTGNKHTVTARDRLNQDLARKVQRVLDRFNEDNSWEGDYDRQCFRRDRTDGEFALSLWRVSGSRVAVRDVEPVSITEPGPTAEIERWLGVDEGSGSWTFGVHTDRDDVQTIHGYYVQWTGNSSDWDYMPGGVDPVYPLTPDAGDKWLLYAKSNTPRNVKRGWSDFFCTTKNFELARKLLRNVGEGASVQAAIAFFIEYAAGITGSRIQDLIRNRASYSSAKASDNGNRIGYSERFDPGTIVRHGPGTTYKLSALGQNNAPVFVDVVSALLAACAARWRMPLHILFSIGSGGSYASELVKESPFTKCCEVKQTEFVAKERQLYWKVIEFAWRAGEFGSITWSELREAVKLVISPPDVAVRDRDKETDRRLKLMGAGIISAQTVAAEEGYDYGQEQTNGAKPTNVPEIGGDALGPTSSHPPGGAEAGRPRPEDETRHPLMKGETAESAGDALTTGDNSWPGRR